MESTKGLRWILLCFACRVHLAGGFGVLFFSSQSIAPPVAEAPKGVSVEESTPPMLSVSETGGNLDNNNSSSSNADPWISARTALRDPGCCVVSVFGDSENKLCELPQHAHLAVLQDRLADNGPADIDIRAKINTTTIESAFEDCRRVCASMLLLAESGEDAGSDDSIVRPAHTLAQLALGMASFADDCVSGDGGGVFLRIVCASSYKAHDPVFHTDKAPLRGYTTLRGVGTEFVTHPCSPLEYLSLRSLGIGVGKEALRRASEQEFIVMKGDYYYSHPKHSAAASSWWQRAFACVHRSPPGTGGRRVIVSFDLADGDDDREWYEVHKRRQWRAGMTQRKSKLVA